MNEHEKCGRCGRKLKTEKSRTNGFGPVCKRKWNEEKAADQTTFEQMQEYNKNNGMPYHPQP